MGSHAKADQLREEMTGDDGQRAVDYGRVVLGGTLAHALARELTRPEAQECGSNCDPVPWDSHGCRRFGATRIDCAWSLTTECTVGVARLRPDGLVETWSYECAFGARRRRDEPGPSPNSSWLAPANASRATGRRADRPRRLGLHAPPQSHRCSHRLL